MFKTKLYCNHEGNKLKKSTEENKVKESNPKRYRGKNTRIKTQGL